MSHLLFAKLKGFDNFLFEFISDGEIISEVYFDSLEKNILNYEPYLFSWLESHGYPTQILNICQKDY